LAATGAEVIFREKFSLARETFSPELCSVLAMHGYLGIEFDKYERSNDDN
jgi:hypothetical protein